MNPIVSSIIDLEHYLNFMDGLEGVEFSPSAASLYFLIKRAFECKDNSLKSQMIKDVINFKHSCKNDDLIKTAEQLKFVIQQIIPSQERK